MEKKPITRASPNATKPKSTPAPKQEPKVEKADEPKTTKKVEEKPVEPTPKPRTVRTPNKSKPTDTSNPKPRSPYRVNPEDEDRIRYWHSIAGSYSRTAVVAGQNGIVVSPATVTRIIKKGQDKTV